MLHILKCHAGNEFVGPEGERSMSNKCFRCGSEALPSCDEICPACIEAIVGGLDTSGHIAESRLEVDMTEWEWTDEMIEKVIDSWPHPELDQLVDDGNRFYCEDMLVGGQLDYLYKHHRDDLEGISRQEFGAEFGIIDVDWDIENFIRRAPDVVVRLEVMSNYDCCNSFNVFDEDGYLRDVYERVEAGVDKDGYLWEFENGVCGGCLFCFVCKMPLVDVLKLKGAMTEDSAVRVPAGTQFGFHSSFQGASTLFERTTTEEMVLPVREPGRTEYDGVRLKIDRLTHYSIKDVCGDVYFIGPGELELVECAVTCGKETA